MHLTVLSEKFEGVISKKDIFEQYVAENITEDGIKLIRRFSCVLSETRLNNVRIITKVV